MAAALENAFRKGSKGLLDRNAGVRFLRALRAILLATYGNWNFTMHRRQFLKDTSIVVASSLVADQDHETPAKIEFGKSTFKTKFSDAQKTSIPDQLKSDEVISGIFRWES